ncbi:MAG: hypothetical protein CMN87_12060 [Stappia sp.]|uniref:hypothetical protein n=1 Tax=Stappia sp. TaxID=1870903 RepID=UPI000C39FF02|nr:hypothetical protein [Stappia sp.]MBM20735.1 hypothetical protein [Stappia sp.]
MPIDPDDVFFLSATEFWFQSGLVTHNTSHIRLGTGVTPIPTYFGTTITVDPYFPEAAYPIWGLDGLGWTRYSTPVIDRTSLDTRVYGSGTSSSGGEVRLDAGRLQMWADDGTPTFDSEDSRQYLTDVYTGSITIPEVNGGSGGAGGTRLWDVSGGPVRAGSTFAQGMVRLDSEIWDRDWMAIGGTLATVHRVPRFYGVWFPGQPARWGAVATQLQLLTPVFDGGELKIREDYKVAGQQFGLQFKIPTLTFDYVLAVGGFN